MQIRYGLIGAGMMGREHIRNLELVRDAELVAICEPNAEQRELAHALAPKADLETDLDRFLEREDLDALVVATPNFTHFEILCRILEGPPRGVLLEKPAVTTLDQVHRIRTLAADWPKPIWVAMEYRYMPPLARFIHRCDEGHVGNLKMLTIREHRFPFLPKVGDWNRFNLYTGGTLVEKCCHFFDLMIRIYGEYPSRIYASGGVDVNHREERYDGRRPDILDNAYVILEFPQIGRAMLELCMFAEGAWYQEEISAVGDYARLDCRIPGPARFWPEGKEREAELVYSPRESKGPVRETVEVDRTILAAGDHHGATYFQHLKFHAAMCGEGKVEVSLEDGLVAVLAGLAAQQSIAEGRAVNLGELLDEGLIQ